MAQANPETQDDSSPSISPPAQNIDRHPEITIEELTEGDTGYNSELDVLHPDDFEEPISDTDPCLDTSAKENEDSDAAVARGMRHLWVGAQISDQLHTQKRSDSERLKRKHSSTIVGDDDGAAGGSDCQDVMPRARRLRRRIASPANSAVSIYDDNTATSGTQAKPRYKKKVVSSSVTDSTNSTMTVPDKDEFMDIDG